MMLGRGLVEKSIMAFSLTYRLASVYPFCKCQSCNRYQLRHTKIGLAWFASNKVSLST